MARNPRLRALVWVLVGLLATGCSSWQATPLTSAFPPSPPDTLAAAPPASPGAVLKAGLPDKVRLRMRDGREITLEHPVIEGDSLRGINVPTPSRDRPSIGSGPREEKIGRVPRAVALADIDRVEVRKFSGANSLLLLVLIGGLIYIGGLVAYGISLGGTSD